MSHPWKLDCTEVVHSTKTVKLYISYERGSKFECPKCSKQCKVHDGRWREWRHLNIMDYYCYLHIKTPRITCETHGVLTYNRVPYARNESHYSFKFEEQIVTLAKELSVAALSRELEEPDANLRRVIKHYVSQGKKTIDCFDTRRIAVDEKSYKKGHNYITIFTDLDTGQPIYICKGRTEAVFEQFYGKLFDLNGDPHKINKISMDMSKSYISGQQIHFRHAETIFDRFHIKKALNQAIDKVRREEVKRVESLKNTRYIWLKNLNKLTDKQSRLLNQFLDDASLKTAKAYQLKIAFDQLWSINNSKVEDVLQAWIKAVSDSAIRQLIQFKNMIENHLEGVLNSFKSTITNAIAEGINSTAQLTKYRARGFKNVDNFIDMIYLTSGNLKYQFHH